jgi:hypothetical protein
MNSSGFCTSSSTLLENPLHDGRAYAELSANLEGRVVNPMTVLIEEDDDKTSFDRSSPSSGNRDRSAISADPEWRAFAP